MLDTDTEEVAGTEQPATHGWSRVLVIAAAVVAVLLIGAATGLLVAQTRPSADLAAPAPDSVAVGFCQDMSVHHRQAALMAGIARDRTTDPAVQHLAFDIETSQLEQIGRMQGWLNLWGRDPLPLGGHMGWMRGAQHAGSSAHNGDGPVTQMPGMATASDLIGLRQLEGREFDVLFLQLMLRHHQGGLAMMNYAAEHAEAGVVRNLATQMRTAQTAESDLLTDMITDRGGSPLPPPN